MSGHSAAQMWIAKPAHISFRLSDPAHAGSRLKPQHDGRVRCSAWLGSELWRQVNDTRKLV